MQACEYGGGRAAKVSEGVEDERGNRIDTIDKYKGCIYTQYNRVSIGGLVYKEGWMYICCIYTTMLTWQKER